MATIRTAIELHDLFTAPMMNIVQAVDMGVSAMYEMQAAMSEPISGDITNGFTEQMNQAVQAIEEAKAALTAPVTHENTGITWDSPTMPTFTNTGIERFEQEIQSANSMLEQLSSTQADIASMASRTAIFPANMVNDMSTMQSRIQAIQERIQTIESNPLNFGTDRANAELEGLRSQLDQAVHEQNRLNAALEQMDVSAANEAYIRLSHTVSNTERYIRDNVDEQGRFNQEINEGISNADNLMDTIKGLVATYATIQTVGNVIELSDTMTQTTARLDLIVDDGGSVAELQNKIYASAQNARGSYMATADAVSKMGMQASQAFNSNDELIAFTELLNKQFVNAGTSVQGIDSVMLQLTQSMAAGKLQGEELNAVLDNAAPIVQNIQRYLEEVQGIDASNIKELASEGVITAEIIKNSMFYAADEINAKFESMPMTFGQIWQQFENTALMAFQPVLQRMNDLANNEAFNVMVENAVNAIATVAIIVMDIFEVMAAVGSFMYENWSILEPLVYGLVAALALYATYLGITKAAELASAAGKVIMCVAAYAHAAATGAEVAATTAATAAQYGFNAALLACPLTWIILLIIAVIAIIYAVCAAIAKLTGIANSGFGVITGGINVVIAFFKNLGLSVANIALGIGNAIAAVASNIMTAFHNAICSVQAWWYDLLSTVLNVVAGICEALNKLPFVEFDYSGITAAADNYAAKSAEAAGNKEDYKSVADAFNEGFSTFDTFQDGWASDAFASGAAWGDGVADSVSSAVDGLFSGSGTDIPNPDDYAYALDNSGVGSGIGDISDNTGSIADSMEITEEEMKYLRDIAEQEAINRFTTAEITINQTNNNNVNKDVDLDGFVSGLTDAVNEAVDIITEGVHE